MVNEAIGDWEKKILRMGLGLVSKHLNKSAVAREECLRITTNKPISILNKLIIVASGNLKAPWQAKTTKTFGQFALWIFLKDTAYRDIFFWMLYKLLKMANKLIPLVEPYVKEPKDWYPNQWIDSLNATTEGKKDGSIPANGKSEAEKMFTPSIQEERFKKMRG
jgi:hypothetical protein